MACVWAISGRTSCPPRNWQCLSIFTLFSPFLQPASLDHSSRLILPFLSSWNLPYLFSLLPSLILLNSFSLCFLPGILFHWFSYEWRAWAVELKDEAPSSVTFRKSLPLSAPLFSLLFKGKNSSCSILVILWGLNEIIQVLRRYLVDGRKC